MRWSFISQVKFKEHLGKLIPISSLKSVVLLFWTFTRWRCHGSSAKNKNRLTSASDLAAGFFLFLLFFYSIVVFVCRLVSNNTDCLTTDIPTEVCLSLHWIRQGLHLTWVGTFAGASRGPGVRGVQAWEDKAETWTCSGLSTMLGVILFWVSFLSDVQYCEVRFNRKSDMFYFRKRPATAQRSKSSARKGWRHREGGARPAPSPERSGGIL